MSTQESLNQLTTNIVAALTSIKSDANAVKFNVYRPNVEVYPGDVVEFIIPNFDNMGGDPAIFSQAGDVELIPLGDGRAKVRYTAPVDPGNDRIQVDNNEVQIAVEAKRIAKPSIVSLVDGQTDIPEGYNITSSPFVSKPAGEYTHGQSTWEFANDVGFTDIHYATTSDGFFLESVTVNSFLNAGSTYYVRVKHQDTAKWVDSEWSDTVSFTMAAPGVSGTEIAIFQGVANDQHESYGRDIAINNAGNVIVVADPQRSTIHIHELVDGSWMLSQSISRPGSLNGEVSISDDGNVIAAGASIDSDLYTYGGAAYVFERTDGAWNEIAKLMPYRTYNSVYVGRWVKISGDGNTVVTSSDKGDSGGYYAHVYKRSQGWGGYYFRVTSLGSHYHGSGMDLSYDGQTFVTSSYVQNWVKIYTLNDTGYTEDHVINHPLGSSNADAFGIKCCLSATADLLFISATGDYTPDGIGAIYIFENTGGGWSHLTSINNGSGANGWGRNISISNDGAVLLVTANADGSYEHGTAFTYMRDGNVWSQDTTITTRPGAWYLKFGYAGALSGDGETAVISDNDAYIPNSVYVFR